MLEINPPMLLKTHGYIVAIMVSSRAPGTSGNDGFAVSNPTANNKRGGICYKSPHVFKDSRTYICSVQVPNYFIFPKREEALIKH